MIPCLSGLSYRKGLTWNRTFDPEQSLCLQPVELGTALDAVRNPEPAEREYVSRAVTFTRLQRQSLRPVWITAANQ